MDNPYRSCRLTRHARCARLESQFPETRDRVDAIDLYGFDNVVQARSRRAYSCNNPYGEPLLQLQAKHVFGPAAVPMENPCCSCTPNTCFRARRRWPRCSS